ncbi:MAG: YfhO family protein [Leptolinea sp.]|nr:YfhO family protein [Leptolinea sp.]
MTKQQSWWLFLVPCIPILAAWDRFIVPAGTSVSDILITHYPNLLFIQRSLASDQGIPLWSPLILSGYPFTANPLSTLWYPPAWLSLLFPLPLGINLVMAMHIFIGCLGFYRLLCRMQLDNRIAALGGMIYGWLPAGYAHMTAGHFTWVCASAWLPWLLIFCVESLSGEWKTIIRAGFFFGVTALVDLRFTAYSAILWLAYLIFNIILHSSKGSRFGWMRSVGKCVIVPLAAAGLSAIVWLPLMEYTGLSTRSLMTIEDSLFLSLPPVQLTGLVVPGHPASIEWILYSGAGCLLLACLSFSFLKKRRELAFWLGAAVIFIVWSLGDGLTINRWLVALPGFDLLRVPARGVFFSSVSLLVTAMISLDVLVKNPPQKVVFLRLGTLFLTILIVMLQVFVILSNPQKNAMLGEYVIIWLAVAGLILSFSYLKISSHAFLICFSVLSLIDLSYFDFTLTSWLSSSEALTQGSEEVQYLQSAGSEGRIFSPSYSIPQHTAAYNQLELADGIDPLQLRAYSQFVRQAGNLDWEGYSVTLPPFKTGDLAKDNLDIQPDPRTFGLLNVQYLVSAFPISMKDWDLVKETKNNYLYHNRYARGWAWIETNGIEDQRLSENVTGIIREPDRILLNASGPGKLVLSEINYPGWQAWVDGQSVEIKPAHEILRAIDLDAGTHRIEFQFKPFTPVIGMVVSVLTCLLIFLRLKGKLIYG